MMNNLKKVMLKDMLRKLINIHGQKRKMKIKRLLILMKTKFVKMMATLNYLIINND